MVMWDFPLFPDRASSMAGQIDAIFAALVGTSALIVLLIVVLLVRFAVKYRRGSHADRSPGRVSAARVEMFLVGAPTLVALAIFYWAAEVYFRVARPPDDTLDIYVVGQQWMWKAQHPGGQREINALHVPVGQPVRLILTSQDVIHSFYVPAFRVKQDVLPDRFTTLWFEPTKVGGFHLFCAEYCGADHARMRGAVQVLTRDAFERWLHENRPGADAEANGPGGASRGAFQRFGCHNCHTPDSAARAPTLQGLFGSVVRLQGGGTTVADEDYIRDSIVQPNAKHVEGYPPIMPSYRGQLSPDELVELIQHIKSLPPQGQKGARP